MARFAAALDWRMRTAQPHRTDDGLVRAIGTRALAASIVNTTIGAGIFVLPAAVAGSLGPAAPVAYLVCALAMALIVTSFAIAGSRVSLSGGIYAYVEVAFGPYAGFLAGVLLYLSNLLAVASVAGALVASVGLVVPMAGAGPGRAIFLCGVIGAFAWLNVRGVRIGARAVEIGTAAKLLPLLACSSRPAPGSSSLPHWPGRPPLRPRPWAAASWCWCSRSWASKSPWCRAAR